MAVTNVEPAVWYVVAGGVLVVTALAFSKIKQLPFTAAIAYLVVGVGLEKSGILSLEALSAAPIIEILSELIVIVSIFSVGLKLRVPWGDARWRLPVRLATVSMVLTVAGVTLAAHTFLGLPWGAAVLLGGVLAPTDPVLASDVQLTEPSGRDRLRFALTGEGGMNDGTAFPAIMLGIGLMGLHEIGPAGTRWLAVDLGWAVAGGLGIGALFGWSVGKVCLYFRRRHREATGLDDFLAMGLVALSYGAALLCEAYGFLAVFAAGAALRRIELGETFMEEIETDPVLRAPEAAVRPGTAPAYMTRAVLTFNEQLERIGEVVVVVLVGALLGEADWRPATLVFALALFFVIRPAAVVLGLLGEGVPARDLQYMSWFGIRGVGSVYYLFFAINQGMDLETAQGLVGVTVTIIAMSIVAHGVSVTPLMSLYGTGRRRGLRLGGDR